MFTCGFFFSPSNCFRSSDFRFRRVYVVHMLSGRGAVSEAEVWGPR